MSYSKEENAEPVRIPDVKCIAVSKSNKAILCEHDDWDKPMWIPQSLIHEDSEVYVTGTEGVLVVPRWFARKENLL